MKLKEKIKMDTEIQNINKNIRELSLKVNKKEDDLLNIINEKDNEIIKINEKLLEQENIIKENRKEISNLYNKMEEIINLFFNKNKENENNFDLIKDNIKNEKDNIFKEISSKYDELQTMTNNIKNEITYKLEDEIYKINKKNENYITMKVLVNNDDINKDIILINQCNIYKYYQNFELNDIDILIDNEYVAKKYKNIHDEFKYDEQSKNCEKSQRLSYELNKLYCFYWNFSNEGVYDIKIIFKKNLFSCNDMFLNCNKIIEIDCSHFNCSQVTSCISMFKSCSSLKKINFGKLDFSIVSYFDEIFCGCKNLVDLDVSNFNTKNSLSFSSMFKGCTKLKEIDVSKFNSSKCESIEFMFYDCQNIKEINMINFDMSNIKKIKFLFFERGGIEGLFCGCRKLKVIKMNLNFNNIEKLLVKQCIFFSEGNIEIFEGISKKGVFTLKKGTNNTSLIRKLPKDWIIKEE